MHLPLTLSMPSGYIPGYTQLWTWWYAACPMKDTNWAIWSIVRYLHGTPNNRISNSTTTINRLSLNGSGDSPLRFASDSLCLASK